MVYPEIYDISNYDEWKKKFARKEIVTNEWDLICNEVATDIFEIPMFTSEYCDKLVENLKGEKGESLAIWGHECEEMEIPDEVTEVLGKLILDHLMNAFFHQWTIDIPSFQKMKMDSHFIRFKKNQDLRPRHDSSVITCYVKLDGDSEGGELIFPKYDFTLKPKQGHVYFFPGRLTHRYGINFIKKGINNSVFIYFVN